METGAEDEKTAGEDDDKEMNCGKLTNVSKTIHKATLKFMFLLTYQFV
jgi:hypothetical protein